MLICSESLSCCLFCLSSRRRHTRCALVTGVQTCALPIFPVGGQAFETCARLAFEVRETARDDPSGSRLELQLFPGSAERRHGSTYSEAKGEVHEIGRAHV